MNDDGNRGCGNCGGDLRVACTDCGTRHGWHLVRQNDADRAVLDAAKRFVGLPAYSAEKEPAQIELERAVNRREAQTPIEEQRAELRRAADKLVDRARREGGQT